MFNKNILGQWQFITVLILMTVGIYIQTLQFEFLNYDDNLYIILNPNIEQGLTWSGIKWAWTSFGNDYDPYFMPLTWLSFLLDAQIFGIDAAGFHFTNMLLHLANTILVLYVLYILTGRFTASALVAALFAVHPQHVEAVAWIAERKEVLSAFFGLLAIACYAKYCHCQHLFLKQNSYLSRYYLLSFLFFFMSLLTKPTMVTLPCLLLLLDWYPLNRFNKKSFKKIIIEKIPFFVLSACLMWLILHSVGTDTANPIITSQNLPLFQRISNTFIIYVNYLGNTFFPVNMPGWYPYPMHALPQWYFYSSLSLLVAITVLTLLYIRKKPYLFMGWSWFIGMILPAASVGVYANGDVFIADRWTYLPHIGLFVAIIWYLSNTVSKRPGIKPFIYSLAIVLILSLTVTSWFQIKYWKNSETYWLHILEADDGFHFPNFMMGTYYRDLKRFDEAMVHFYKAHKNHPDEAYYIVEIGNIYINKDEYEKAWEYYDMLISLPYVSSDLLVRIGAFNAIQQRLEESKALLYRVLDNPDYNNDPYYFQAHFYLGHVLAMSGDDDKAQYHFKTYINNPNNNINLQCGTALELTRELIGLGISANDLNKSYKMLTKLCA